MKPNYWENRGSDHASSSLCPEILVFNQGSSWYRAAGFEHLTDEQCKSFAKGYDEGRSSLHKTSLPVEILFDPAELMDTVSNIQAIIKRATQ